MDGGRMFMDTPEFLSELSGLCCVCHVPVQTHRKASDCRNVAMKIVNHGLVVMCLIQQLPPLPPPSPNLQH